jgi:hypothetical protein
LLLLLLLLSDFAPCKDYWTLSGFEAYDPCTDRLIFVEILETHIFLDAVRIGSEVMVQPAHGHWSHLPPYTFRKCLESVDLNAVLTSSILQQWLVKFPGLDIGSTLAMQVPLPHSVLILTRVWQVYAFVHATGRVGRGLRCNLALPLISHIGLGACLGPGPVFLTSISPDALQRNADTFRLLLAVVDGPGNLTEALRAQATMHVAQLQAMRDTMVHDQYHRLSSVYPMTLLLECLMLAGFLRADTHFMQVVANSIKVACPFPEVQKVLLDRLAEKSAAPSSATIQRHRTTAILGYCVHRQMLAQKQFDDGDQIISWGTIDSSPFHYHDWLNQGSRNLPEL